MQIYIKDDLPPESMAMLQALYSRSPASVLDHLKKVEAVGADKFMGTYYVGYNHKSIGDCGDTTIFIEDVSMLAAKAIQDWPLYRGQEASTRYMDFSNARIEDPVGTQESAEILQAWMEFYNQAQEPMLRHLYATYPQQEDQEDAKYENAIKARCFDIMRGFLPAGCTTNLSWRTDLRQASDHLRVLQHHPDDTIRGISEKIWDGLREKYPSSFGIPYHSVWETEAARLTTYNRVVDTALLYGAFGDPSSTEVLLDTQGLRITGKYQSLLETRPRYAEIPARLGKLGMIHSRFLLDFGSFRDLQRHRNGIVEMPLLHTGYGFHPWYLQQLPDELRISAAVLIRAQEIRIAGLKLGGVSPEAQQYYCAMGFRVLCDVTQTLPAWVYRVELRSTPTVHATLRAVVQKEASLFEERFPGIALHVDYSPDTWSYRRGKQTITEK